MQAQNPRLLNSPAHALVALLLFLVSTVYGSAQSTGSLAGSVSNSGTHAYLQGVRLSLTELDVTTTTDENGRYTFYDLPAGTYTVRADYTGLNDLSQRVAVTSGSRARLDFDLTSDIYLLNAFVVEGEREGNAASITRQKNAPNVKSVVSLDAMGNLSNDNAGELLVRLSGVAGRIDDEGNITGVYVRGANPNLTTVSVDGNLQASTGGMGRDFRTHAISGALFDELEVTKAPTPDMPSDSLGGAVNLKTGSTLNMKQKRQISFRAAARWAPPFTYQTPTRADNRVHPLLSLKYREIFDAFGGKDNLGVSVSAFNSQNVSGYYKTVQDYEYTTDSPAYVWDYRTYDAFNNRKQSSVKIRVDGRISPTTTIYFNTIYNKADEANNPIYYMRAYSSRSLATVASDGTASGGLILPDYTDTFTEVRTGSTGSRVQLYSYLYSFLTTEQQFNLGVKHELENWDIDYEANYNFSHPDLGNGEGGNAGGIFSMEVRRAGWTLDKSQSEVWPDFQQTAGPDLYDIENYTSGLLTTRNNDRDTDILNGNFNARYKLPTRFPASVKFGGRYRSQRVEEVGRDRRWNFVGAGSLAPFLKTGLATASGVRAGKELPFIDTSLVSADIVENPSNWSEDLSFGNEKSFTGTRHVEEAVTALYVQGTAKVGKLDILGGVRGEKTEVESVGYIETDDGYELRVTKGEYDDLFPGLHLTYHFNDRFQVRSSWSNSVGRPRFSDLLPVEVANDEQQTLNVNNPSLKPQYASNIDLSLEYYFEPVGQLSLGYFRKAIKDFIVSERGGIVPDGPDNGFGGQYAGYSINSEFNGGSATVEGIEFSYQQEFDFLPGPLKGLGGFLNVTALTTSGDYGESTQKSTEEVADFIPNMGNAGLTWKLHPFSMRVMANYTDAYLASYSSDASRLRYRDARTIISAGAQYKLPWNGLTFAVDVNNLTNEPTRYYRYTGERLQQLNLTGTSVTFSLSGRF